MATTLQAICNSIESTLDDVAAIKRSQSYSELTESYPDLPLLQVYPNSGETDVQANNDRSTFGAGRRISEIEIYCDIPCRQRSHLDEDMTAVVGMIEDVTVKLEAQTKPLFGNVDIKGFRWRWEKATFQPQGGDIYYPGVRVIIWVRIF